MAERENDRSIVDKHVWEQGWQDHRQRQLERLARLPLPQKLAWLEEAHRLVMQMTANKNRSKDA